MIRYDLVCDRTHEFEGWFRDSAAFADQASRGLISCPDCGRTVVRQALAMPAVKTARACRPVAEAERPMGAANSAASIPETVRMALQQMRAAVERSCEDMGDRFADEAIRIAEGQAPERGIYGQTTARDRERLDDAGVDVVAMPWVPRNDG